MSERRGVVLAVILVGYLLILVDVSILMAALPTIKRELDFSPAGLSWAQNAYTSLGAPSATSPADGGPSWPGSACSPSRRRRSGSPRLLAG